MAITVSGLNIYPIKSCGGIALTSAHVTRRGLADDRRWMVVDPHGEFLTQRTLPRMTLIRTEIVQGKFQITAPGLSPISLPPKPVGKSVPIDVWGDLGHAVDGGDELAQWFTTFLGTPCRLAYQPQSEIRAIHEGIEPERNTLSYADRYPLLLISEGSLNDLNSRLGEKMEMERFRPNIILSGAKAFEEDQWQMITINDVELEFRGPRARCPIPTIDLKTAEMGKEPLATLARYRRHEGQVLFGQNVIPYTLGTINVGDVVKIH